ncbi:MAG TPA: DMT family transporter, partial [Anaerovoracaceae bacterium]|nr:DMT family transporter [Anaerovoracaceae bacterium]
AICFLLWNFAVETLGPVKTATYIYFTPIVTIIASIIILKEPFTLISLSGTILIILGLIYSERKNKPDFIDENSVSTINPAHNENCNG